MPSSTPAAAAPAAAPARPSDDHPWLPTPAPIRRLFAAVPLATLPANPLPARTLPPAARRRHQLYVLPSAPPPPPPNPSRCNRPDAASAPTPPDADPAPDPSTAPSLHPGCLRAQALLRFRGVAFGCVPASPHAAPGGALPFLLPTAAVEDDGGGGNSGGSGGSGGDGEGGATCAAEEGKGGPAPVGAAGIEAWSRAQARRAGGSAGAGAGAEETNEEEDDERELRGQAYAALVERRIRPAWLYEIYLSDAFERIARPRYIDPQTSVPAVRAVLAYQLQATARREIARLGGWSAGWTGGWWLSEWADGWLPGGGASGPTTAAADLAQGAEAALEALEALLGADAWFLGAPAPGALDAAVFAYTHPILALCVGALARAVERCAGLVAHRRRVLERFFAAAAEEEKGP